MDTSLRLPAADISALQSARPPVRPAGTETPPDAGAAAPQSGVEVSISVQGRAAVEAAQLEASAVAAAVPAETAQAAPVAAAAEVAQTAPTVSAVATPGPAADPARVEQAQTAAAEARGVSTAQVQAEQQPDAATAANSPSVQLYLDNSERAPAQAGPSAVRASA